MMMKLRCRLVTAIQAALAVLTFADDPGSVQHMYPNAGRVQGGNVVTIAGLNLGFSLESVEFVVNGVAVSTVNQDGTNTDDPVRRRANDGILMQKPEASTLTLTETFDWTCVNYPALPCIPVVGLQVKQGVGSCGVDIPCGTVHSVNVLPAGSDLTVVISTCVDGVSAGPTLCKRFVTGSVSIFTDSGATAAIPGCCSVAGTAEDTVNKYEIVVQTPAHVAGPADLYILSRDLTGLENAVVRLAAFNFLDGKTRACFS